MSTVSTNNAAVAAFCQLTGATRGITGGLCLIQGFPVRVKGVTTPTVSGVHPLNGEPLCIRYEAGSVIEWYVVSARWILGWADDDPIGRRHMCAHAFDCCQFSISSLLPAFSCTDPTKDGGADLRAKALAEATAAARAKWMVDIMVGLHEQTTSNVCHALSQLLAGPPGPAQEPED